jgi:hypothetical protein
LLRGIMGRGNKRMKRERVVGGKDGDKKRKKT